MPNYKWVKCIAFCIKPGGVGRTPSLLYLGDPDTKTDIEKRCEIMKAAIAEAYPLAMTFFPKVFVALGVGGNIRGLDPVLKIFMAPEFFFRGRDGAYDIDKIETIIPIMAKEVGKKKYKDWLFVYGTAVGYLRRDETITKVVWRSKSGTQTFVQVDPLVDNVDGWEICEYTQAKVKGVEALDGGRCRLTLDTHEHFKISNTVSFVYGKDADRTQSRDILASDSKGGDGRTRITIKNLTKPVQNEWVAEIRDFTKAGRVHSVATIPFTTAVDKVKSLGGDRVEITLKTRDPIHKGESVKLTRAWPRSDAGSYPVTADGTDPVSGNATIQIRYPGHERLNKCPSCGCTAFKPGAKGANLCGTCAHTHQKDPIQVLWSAEVMRKGWLLTNDEPLLAGHLVSLKRMVGNKQKEVFNLALVQQGGNPGTARKPLLVYKEDYSTVDYMDDAAASKTAYVIGKEESELLDTEKSARTAEVSGSGLGGESVFTVNNCTIGLEICLDHLENRLAKYYDASGGDKPHIHLIPSMGMAIGRGRVCCRDKGIVFNVDGGRGDSVLRVYDGTYSCDSHPDENQPVAGERCPKCMQYRCSNCGNFTATDDGKSNHPCPNCGNLTLKTFFICRNYSQCNTWSPVAGNCPTCSSAVKPVPLQEFDKKLPQVGTVVKPAATSGPVDVPGWDVTGDDQLDYFQGKGEVVVYPAKRIPGT